MYINVKNHGMDKAYWFSIIAEQAKRDNQQTIKHRAI
jgi:hypothetical protein